MLFFAVSVPRINPAADMVGDGETRRRDEAALADGGETFGQFEPGLFDAGTAHRLVDGLALAIGPGREIELQAPG
jgi:hypothetical protein